MTSAQTSVRCPVVLSIASTALLLTAATTHAAEEKPLWEAGLGVAALTFPAYRGSDQSSSFWLPAPYFTYRGKFLRADRNGVRGQLFESDRIDITISAALSPPAASEDIRARAGMPDLDTNFEVGPQVDLTLWRSETHAHQLKLLVPLRAAFTLESNPKSLGWVFHPKLNLDLTHLPHLPGWNLGIQVGPLFGDRRQHSYFYGVDATYATATRPSYEARGGFAGLQYLVGISKRYSRHWVGAFVRYDNLNNARFADSPLVLRRNYIAAGLAVSWILGESATRVLVDD
jgi:MipA family protein